MVIQLHISVLHFMFISCACHLKKAKEFRSALICNLPSVLQPNLINETSKQSIPANASNGDFDVSVVISLNPSPSDTDCSILNLRYWIVVTNRQQLFPKQNLEKKLALFNAIQTKVTVSSKLHSRFSLFLCLCKY